MKFTNEHNIPLPLTVWLLHDTYDYNADPNHISATSLLKPTRQLVLNRRIVDTNVSVDVSTLIASTVGTSLHAGIEDAWRTGYQKAMKRLGIPEETIARVHINPEPDQLQEDTIPVYIEQRYSRWLDGFHISGKVDMIAEGTLQDYKSTSTYTYMHNTREEEHRLQGSIYRWLEPNKITSDYISINYIFTDWQKSLASSNPDYPQTRLLSKNVSLMSLEETEHWIRHKLQEFSRFVNADELDIPYCTDKELWLSPPQFRFYSNPEKTDGRSTKNFADYHEAMTFQQAKGKGVIITRMGAPKRCGYCNSYEICSQKDQYFSSPDEEI